MPNTLVKKPQYQFSGYKHLNKVSTHSETLSILHTDSLLPLSLPSPLRLRHMQGMRESQLTADVELLPNTDTTKQKQTARPPISMNFEVLYTNFIGSFHIWSIQRSPARAGIV